ncbi:MAG: FAD-dependent oxidoreductase [bacterium]|nr:FAD-dependent oxidoreductase [bacterium]
MLKLFSIDDLRNLREIITSDIDIKKPCINICGETACLASEANLIVRAAKGHILGKRLHDKISLRITGCHGFCEMGPTIVTEPQNAFYVKVKSEDVPRIIDATLKNKYVDELLYTDPKSGTKYYSQNEIPFFKNQKRTVFSRNQKIDPIRIYDYIASGGYLAIEKVLSGMTREQVVNEIKNSGLRGRGGAGFPTGLKWEMLAKQPSDEGKYIVCNADEGDPGAYMDRSLLEGNPHGVIEGMLIGAFATGATKAIVYVRNEYPMAIKHLIIALSQARDLGLIGENILGTDFSLDFEVVKGAGAFVCGEETALMRSVEGKVGEPRQRPPFPVEKGIYGKPTAINNVETWANIPIIIEKGASEYAKIGTKGNSGTKIFSLVGKIKNTGLVEVPMGITIKKIVYDIGGGSIGNARIKAVQTGGPSGGCIPADKFDLHIDYDSLAQAGSIMGSGGMIVMDEKTCMVDVAKYFMNFLKSESCGKCFTCRKGTQRMYELLDEITRGQGTMEKLDLLEELALAVKDTTMCGLGQTASNPVLSTLKYFHDEYVQHIIYKRCPAGVCTELVGAPCQNACPVGTEAWRYVALIEKGEYEEAYKVIRAPNPFPSVCARVCDHKCEANCRLGTTGGQPIAVRALKRFITDTVDPSVYNSEKFIPAGEDSRRIAVIGAGPSGLTAAYYLSLDGYRVSVFESEDRPGGMLACGIPEYRLPRNILEKEIDALLNENIKLECNKALGRDFTVDGLFKDGFDAVFLSMGAHKSRTLEFGADSAPHVFSSINFLKAYNLRGEFLAKGRVGVIGGGNSAVDAARAAFRQPDVQNVVILYRRTINEMPAYEEEIKAALEEGVEIRELVTPGSIFTQNGKLTGIECFQNVLGDIDASGRRQPVLNKSKKTLVSFDTLIVGIGEHPDTGFLKEMEIAIDSDGKPIIDPDTLATSREGVFAGGDLVTGSSTVIGAIAMGKKAALVIGRYLRNEELWQTPEIRLPDFFLEPSPESDVETDMELPRIEIPEIPVESRADNFSEVERTISREAAKVECGRCLRCDLAFTQKREDEIAAVGDKAK